MNERTIWLFHTLFLFGGLAPVDIAKLLSFSFVMLMVSDLSLSLVYLLSIAFESTILNSELAAFFIFDGVRRPSAVADTLHIRSFYSSDRC